MQCLPLGARLSWLLALCRGNQDLALVFSWVRSQACGLWVEQPCSAPRPASSPLLSFVTQEHVPQVLWEMGSLGIRSRAPVFPVGLDRCPPFPGDLNHNLAPASRRPHPLSASTPLLAFILLGSCVVHLHLSSVRRGANRQSSGGCCAPNIPVWPVSPIRVFTLGGQDHPLLTSVFSSGLLVLFVFVSWIVITVVL